jgi:enoyl-[acyl-carrier protein] reductase II
MRVVRNAYTGYYDEHPGELAAFPAQLGKSIEDGAFHLGGGEDTPDIDPERECYPAGQGVGAIQTLMPAASIVHQMVDQAQHIMAQLGAVAAG